MATTPDPDATPLSDDELEVFEALTGQLRRRRLLRRRSSPTRRWFSPRVRLFAAGMLTVLAISAVVALLAVSHWAAFAMFAVTALVLVNRFPSLNEAMLTVRNDAVERLQDATRRQQQ